MPNLAVLAFKNPVTGEFIDNLQHGGVKVRVKDENGYLVWVPMSTANTFVKNPDAEKDPSAQAWTTLI